MTSALRGEESKNPKMLRTSYTEAPFVIDDNRERTLLPSEMMFPLERTTLVVVSLCCVSCVLWMVSSTSFVFRFSSFILFSSASICNARRSSVSHTGSSVYMISEIQNICIGRNLA